MQQSDFVSFHNLVQSVFDQGRQRSEYKLVLIDVETDYLSDHHKRYVSRHQPLAVTCGPNDNFSIWISPSYKEDSLRFRLTLAHELVHGYAGLTYGHNAHWRRWFYRTLWHLDQSGLIPEMEDPLRMVSYSLGYLYNHSESDELSLIDEAHKKAESEHDLVMENYWRRTCQR